MNREQITGLATIGMMTLSLPLSLSAMLSPSPTPDDYSPEVVSTDSLYDTDSLPVPSETERGGKVALVHDPETNVSIVYPSTLPPCDNEDGTAVSNGKLVAACKWDASSAGINSSGDSFIVIAPLP